MLFLVNLLWKNDENLCKFGKFSKVRKPKISWRSKGWIWTSVGLDNAQKALIKRAFNLLSSLDCKRLLMSARYRNLKSLLKIFWKLFKTNFHRDGTWGPSTATNILIILMNLHCYGLVNSHLFLVWFLKHKTNYFCSFVKVSLKITKFLFEIQNGSCSRTKVNSFMIQIPTSTPTQSLFHILHLEAINLKFSSSFRVEFSKFSKFNVFLSQLRRHFNSITSIKWKKNDENWTFVWKVCFF